MKIAIIDMDSLRNPHWGTGQARATREIFKRLSLKHSITVYCSKYPGYRDYTEDGIEYIHTGINHSNPQLTNLIFLISIPGIAKRIKADIIIENFHAPTSTGFSPAFTHIPVIGIPTMFNAVEFSKKYHLPFDWVEKIGLKFYKYMTAYSNTDSGKIRKLNPQIKYKIIPQGVGKEYFNIQRKPPKHILFLGRFDINQKGIDLLLQSYAKVRNSIKYPLVLAGHGSDVAVIKKIVDTLQLRKHVSIVGAAYGQKKENLISEAIFAAFPSRHDEMSLWSLEALASGLPLAAFNLPESEWMDNDVCLKAMPFDTDEYARLLLSLTNPSLNIAMSNNSRNFASHFSWDQVAKKYEEFIYEVLSIEKPYAIH